jgi:hypothetical protein
MRVEARTLFLVISLAAAAACNKPATENNVAIDINNADPNDIEALPPDESSATPSDQLANGADNADVNEANSIDNNGD